MSEVLGTRDFYKITENDNAVLTVVSVLDDIGNVDAPSPSVGDKLEWDGSNWVPAAGANIALPEEYDRASSPGESTTTSSTYQTKLTLNATGLTSGYTYCIAFNSIVGSYNDDKHVDYRLTVDGTTYVEGHTSGKTAGDSGWSFSGVIFLTGLSGSEAIDLDFSDGGHGGTALMKNAYLQIWRTE